MLDRASCFKGVLHTKKLSIFLTLMFRK